MELTPKYKAFIDELDSSIYTPDNLLDKHKKICDKYFESLEKEGGLSLKLFRLEHEVIEINKSISGGLTPKLSGTKTNDNGEEVDFIWPDYELYDEESLNYFLERFNDSTNTFLRTHYGLMAFNSDLLKHNELKAKLIEVLFENAQECFKKLGEADKQYKSTYYISENLRDAFELAVLARNLNKAEDIVRFVQGQFDSTSPDGDGYYTFFYLITDFYLDYKKELSRYLDVTLFLKKVFSDAEVLVQKDDYSGAMVLLKKGLLIVQKHEDIPNEVWQKKIGECYEKLGDKEIERENYFGCSNYDKAGKYFQESGEKELQERVLKKYEDSSGKIELGLFTSELSDEEVDDLDNWIDNIVAKNDPALILSLSTLKPNMLPVQQIRENAKELPKGFWIEHVSPALMDKYGRIAERYETELQKEEYRFWELFGHNLQFSSKIAFSATVKAFQKGVIDIHHVIGGLSVSWLNEPIKRYYNGKDGPSYKN